ncbi:MAG: hypothetical protein JO340_02045 [Acidobacteriaceae bacterium]|nr:hypothetical protein [Acidobacteriaceae bacterium]
MKLRIVLSVSLLIVPAALVAQLSTPKIGMVRYADHMVRGVNGLESNMLLGDRALLDADTASFSDFGGLVSIAGRIQLLNSQATLVGEYQSNEPSPVLNMDGALSTAIAWLPSHSLLVYWNGAAFLEAQLPAAELPGQVTSLQLVGPTLARMLLTDADGGVSEASISLPTGRVLSSDALPGVVGPAFLQDGFIVFESPNGLAIQAPNGAVRTLPLRAGALSFERMSSEWVHIASRSTQQDWALHLSSKALQLSILPTPVAAGGSQLRHDQEVAK